MEFIKKNLKIIICLATVGLIAAGLLGIIKYRTEQKYSKIIKTATKETKLIDANYDHNQALDFSDYIKSQNLKLPKIIINFDTHSDLYINKPITIPKEEGIASWINAYLAKYPEVDELYWVMPTEEALEPELQKLFAQHNIHNLADGIEFYGNSLYLELPEDYFEKNPLSRIPYAQEFYIDKRNGMLNEYLENNKYSQKIIEQYLHLAKKVKITTCTKETLPDFKNQKVFLSIDADYLSNSGFDTLEDFTLQKNKKEIKDDLYGIFELITEKGIIPEYISMSLSPQYLPQKHHKYVYKNFKNIIKYAKKKDPISIYNRGYDISPTNRDVNEIIDYTKKEN